VTSNPGHWDRLVQYAGHNGLVGPLSGILLNKEDSENSNWEI